MINSIFFLGGKQAGCIGVLTMLAMGYRLDGIVTYDTTIARLADELNLTRFTSVKDDKVAGILPHTDLLVCVHGREIVPGKLLNLPRLGSINVHPCLFAYKGANPVNRLLGDNKPVASVGVHRMTEVVDEGEVLVEEFLDVQGMKTAAEVYSALYPYYSIALIKAVNILGGKT